MTTSAKILENMEQGSPEWHALRKTKITATDASIIMGANPWKTKLQLYHEKISNEPPKPPNERMKRGIDLEPIARDLFCLKTGYQMKPAVVVKDWTMASLDGIAYHAYFMWEGEVIVEIKCPGEKDHALAVEGKIPEHYYPQLQHQLFVSNAAYGFYFSFDGTDGVSVPVRRNEEYIEKMLVEEKKFYDCLINKIPPEPEEKDYIEKDDPLWEKSALQWKLLQQSKKDLEEEEEELRQRLIFLSGGCASRGSGISLASYQRKGNIDYSKVEALRGLDLEQYRKPTTTSCRITCH